MCVVFGSPVRPRPPPQQSPETLGAVHRAYLTVRCYQHGHVDRAANSRRTPQGVREVLFPQVENRRLTTFAVVEPTVLEHRVQIACAYATLLHAYLRVFT